MDKQDYRNTINCLPLEQIEEKKAILLKRIREEGHPRARDHYPIVKDTAFKAEFNSIFNGKCAYCGAATYIHGINYFEVDHLVNDASFNSRADSGDIMNLVLSCMPCNRNKSSYPTNYATYNPENLKKYFWRNNNYGIEIEPYYQKNLDIVGFYEKLKLDLEFRKLDFLLLKLYHFKKLQLSDEIRSLISRIEDILRKKRNSIDILNTEV